MYGRHHTETARQKISEKAQGRKLPPFTEDHRKRIGDANRRRAYKKGPDHPRFGCSFDESHRQAISEKAKLRWSNPEEREKERERQTGLQAGKKNPMYGRSGSLSPNFGKHRSPDTIEKIAQTKRGEKNPQWRGGIQDNPYCERWTRRLRESVRDTFNRKCALCGKTEFENGRRMDVHHIDYNKMQGCGARSWCLMSLCRGCHERSTVWRHLYFNMLYNYWALDREIMFFVPGDNAFTVELRR